MLEPLPDSFAATRGALHALAEHVLAPARYHAEAKIGLINAPGGFGTPVYNDGERLRVEGIELVHEKPGTTTRVGITTLGAAAQFAAVPLGAPTEVYKPATSAGPDTALEIDAPAAHVLADWYAFVAGLLDELSRAYAGHEPSSATLWPEHFDLAIDLGNRDAGTRANYGGSPGDAQIMQPYLYVGPWDEGRRSGPLGTHAFGAALTYEELRAASDPRDRGREFFFDGAALLIGEP
jgi:hypothetical protein